MNLESRYAADVIPFAYQVQITLPAAAVNQTVKLRFDAGSDFELRYIMGTSSLDLDTDFSSNNFEVQIQDGSSKAFLSDGFIPQRVMCGPANNSLILPRFVRFPGNTLMQFYFNNLSAAAENVVTLELHGSKILRPGRVPPMDVSADIIPFWYIEEVNLTALQTNAVGEITLGIERLFELWSIWGTSDQDSASDVSPNNFSARISHVDSGQLLTQNFSPQRLLCRPSCKKLLDPRAVGYPGNTSFKIELQDLSGENSTVQIVFQGYRILH